MSEQEKKIILGRITELREIDKSNSSLIRAGFTCTSPKDLIIFANDWLQIQTELKALETMYTSSH